MKTAEFIDEFAEKGALATKKQAKELMELFWDIIVTKVKKGDEVVFPYGKFVLIKKAKREGRNPMTGAVVQIPAKTLPKFKPNKRFKEEVLGTAKK